VRQEEVAHQQHGVPPLVGQVEAELREIDGLLHRRRREHDEAIVAVPAAARRLEVVALAARHVHGEHRICAFASSAKLSCMRLMPWPVDAIIDGRRSRRAPHHADRFELALGVHADAADVGRRVDMYSRISVDGVIG
jgi:hypothetical protein